VRSGGFARLGEGVEEAEDGALVAFGEMSRTAEALPEAEFAALARRRGGRAEAEQFVGGDAEGAGEGDNGGAGREFGLGLIVGRGSLGGAEGAGEVGRGEAALAAQGREAPKHGSRAQLEPPLRAEAEDAEALGEVAAFYHRTLLQSPEALGFLEKRGLRNQALIERFRLGFANRTLAYRLPSGATKAGAALRARLQALGDRARVGA
jgi:hypothetical protein